MFNVKLSFVVHMVSPVIHGIQIGPDEEKKTDFIRIVQKHYFVRIGKFFLILSAKRMTMERDSYKIIVA